MEIDGTWNGGASSTGCVKFSGFVAWLEAKAMHVLLVREKHAPVERALPERPLPDDQVGVQHAAANGKEALSIRRDIHRKKGCR
jgi:hypothetical protein